MNKKGFTLIEVLVVVAIIGILASIVLIGLAPARQGAQDAKRVSDLKNVQNALELYFSANGEYPPAANYVAMEGVITAAGTNLGISNLPNDPRTASNPSAQDYMYETNGSSYVLGALLDGNPPAGYTAPNTSFSPGSFSCTGVDWYCVTL